MPQPTMTPWVMPAARHGSARVVSATSSCPHLRIKEEVKGVECSVCGNKRAVFYQQCTAACCECEASPVQKPGRILQRRHLGGRAGRPPLGSVRSLTNSLSERAPSPSRSDSLNARRLSSSGIWQPKDSSADVNSAHVKKCPLRTASFLNVSRGAMFRLEKNSATLAMSVAPSTMGGDRTLGTTKSRAAIKVQGSTTVQPFIRLFNYSFVKPLFVRLESKTAFTRVLAPRPRARAVCLKIPTIICWTTLDELYSQYFLCPTATRMRTRVLLRQLQS